MLLSHLRSENYYYYIALVGGDNVSGLYPPCMKKHKVLLCSSMCVHSVHLASRDEVVAGQERFCIEERPLAKLT